MGPVGKIAPFALIAAAVVVTWVQGTPESEVSIEVVAGSPPSIVLEDQATQSLRVRPAELVPASLSAPEENQMCLDSSCGWARVTLTVHPVVQSPNK